LVCLNLPPHIRWLPNKTMLLGVIPGHPSQDQVNHYLCRVIRDFQDLWKGVFYSRTFKYAFGRLTRAAIALVICDMLALRQVLGFPGATATNFCTLCTLPIQQIDNVDSNTWLARHWPTMKEAARQWRDAPNEGQREALWKQTQLRYTPFVELPYWNSLISAPPEPMHWRALGTFQSLIRTVYGINVAVEGSDGTRLDLGIKRPPPERLVAAVRYINMHSETLPADFRDVLLGETQAILATICFDNGLAYGGRKERLVDQILGAVHFLGSF
ncbi:hypothetical protein CYLTODRAFT_353992, partial [Cylindrobasidium torrendii FP15055 ss-10]